jgi:ribosomal protein L14E/L6E/L27E
MSVGGVIGRIVISKAGHDEGKAYAVVAVLDDKHVAVADGVGKLLATPKKKNLRHLSITNAVVSDFAKLLSGEATSSNLKLAKKLKEAYE